MADTVSTRKLIIAAFICGMVILAAGAYQLTQIASSRSNGTSNLPVATTAAPRVLTSLPPTPPSP